MYLGRVDVAVLAVAAAEEDATVGEWHGALTTLGLRQVCDLGEAVRRGIIDIAAVGEGEVGLTATNENTAVGEGSRGMKSFGLGQVGDLGETVCCGVIGFAVIEVGYHAAAADKDVAVGESRSAVGVSHL